MIEKPRSPDGWTGDRREVTPGSAFRSQGERDQRGTVTLAIGLGGILTVVAGLGALAWGRRGAFEMGPVPAAAPTGGLVAGSARPR